MSSRIGTTEVRWYPSSVSSCALNAESAMPSSARDSSAASWRRPFISAPANAGSQREKKGAGVMLW